MRNLIFVSLIVILLGLIGEVKCIYKAVTCNWEPVGKAEVIYTVGSLTGLGAVIGWINIEDK
jgi:hypothetical protein